jgi:dihydrofolate reductase
VIGGASIYAAAWPYCQRFYLTRIGMPLPATRSSRKHPARALAVISDVRKIYRSSARSGREVECRFLQYAQDSPTPLPEVVR